MCTLLALVIREQFLGLVLKYEAVNLTRDCTLARIHELPSIGQGDIGPAPYFHHGLEMTRAVGDCDLSEYGGTAFPEVTSPYADPGIEGS